VRKRLGNFILGEDDQTLEGVVLAELTARDGSLALVETCTAGQIAARIAHLPGAERVFRRGLVARDPAELSATLGLDGALISGELSREAAEQVAQATRQETGASQALAVLIEVDDGPDRIDFGGSVYLAIAAAEGVETRRSRIYGGRDWVRLGAVELASTACAATSGASRSPNAPISSGCERAWGLPRRCGLRAFLARDAPRPRSGQAADRSSHLMITGAASPASRNRRG
jgi:nicotinamide mononucleotide (NMN) deamidase PncC